ncbi:MAG: DinB family protein [Bacteroidota bacterium]
MQEQFRIHRATRQNALNIAQAFTVEQLNYIPPAFNNNLIWNLGHVVVTQQLLIYGLTGNEMKVGKEMVEKYRKGSRPIDPVDEREIQMIQELLISTSDQCAQDFQDGLFKKTRKYPTSYGFEINSVEDAVLFNNIHESMHLGNLLSMRKMIS